MRKKVSVVLLIFTLLLPMGMVTANGNSAQSYWEGIDATGAILSEGDSPIVVEKEVLTFDIQEFPQNNYHEKAEYAAYSAKVTAEYIFYNPSEYTVQAKLLFPYGKIPSYCHIYDEKTGNRITEDMGKYGISVDGEPVATRIRHTLSYGAGKFSVQEDLPRVADDYIEDEFYHKDTSVRVLYYDVEDIKKTPATAAFFWKGDSDKTKIILENMSGGELKENGVWVHTGLYRVSKMAVYVIGEQETLPEWQIFKNGSLEEKVEGTLVLNAKSETMSLYDFAMLGYDEASGILPHDWYNAKITALRQSEWKYGVLDNSALGSEMLSFDHNLMRWYEYEISLAPGQRIINRVTAPMYPAIDIAYKPAVYDYTYYLSPAKTWSEFGSLDIILNTPYYVTNSSISGYAKTDTGYRWSLPGLPDKELEFTLSESEAPEPPTSLGGSINNVLNNTIEFFLTAIMGVLVIIAGLLLILWKRSRNKAY